MKESNIIRIFAKKNWHAGNNINEERILYSKLDLRSFMAAIIHFNNGHKSYLFTNVETLFLVFVFELWVC